MLAVVAKGEVPRRVARRTWREIRRVPRRGIAHGEPSLERARLTRRTWPSAVELHINAIDQHADDLSSNHSAKALFFRGFRNV